MVFGVPPKAYRDADYNGGPEPYYWATDEEHATRTAKDCRDAGWKSVSWALFFPATQRQRPDSGNASRGDE